MYRTIQNMNHPISPTTEFYDFLQFAFSHFNQSLFNNNLPNCMMTIQRQKSVMGYFSADRWSNSEGLYAHEIALNPSYFASHKLIEVLQTLVHEQCHLWQYTHGKNKSRTSYHNREWAEKMQSIGLIPSHNGLPGGKKTGQTMSDYPEKNGHFVISCMELLKSGGHLQWIDTEPSFDQSCQPRNIDHQNILDLEEYGKRENLENLTILSCPVKIEIPETSITQCTQKRKSKSRYTCPNCEVNVWGKMGLNLICGDCKSYFIISEKNK